MKYLITSALPYINGIKHLGTLVGCMLPADVYARYLRAKGNDVLFICATDEHGTPAEISALEENMDVRAYCDKYHKIQKDIYEGFYMSFDHFGRSSSKENELLTQEFAADLMKNGYIEERTIKQIYSVDDGRFLPDRYVTGTCPHCGYEKARGDQCESCTRVLDPTDLVNPRSAISGSTNLEVRETKHLFLKLPALEDKISRFIDSKEGVWPPIVISIARKWIKEGLHERCITRDLKWGVPVAQPGFEDKVFYVWFDAPIEYIGATMEWANLDPEHRDYKKWWYDAKDVTYVEFMGKDNVPFHTITFPCSIIGTGKPWKMVDYLKGLNWLNFYGGKFSTSQHRGIFTDKALEEFKADYWRYWLMANIPEADDVSFTFESFADTINKDLNDVLGNFVSRCLKMTAANFGDTVPGDGSETEEEENLKKTLSGMLADYDKYLSEMQFRKAMAELRAIWVEGNNYFARNEPWKVIKTDKARASVILRTAINLIYIYAELSKLIIPDSAAKIMAMLDRRIENGTFINEIRFDYVKGGDTFRFTESPFSKIAKDRVAELAVKYKAAS